MSLVPLVNRFKNKNYKTKLQNLGDAIWDARLGVDTFGYHPEVGDPQTDGHWRVHYAPTPYSDLFRLFKMINLGTDDVFVDLGAGLGRATFVASYMGAKRAIGIEIAPELCNKAIKNHKYGKLVAHNIEFDCIDANAFKAEGLTVLFMFHPFGPATLKNVIKRVAEDRKDKPLGQLRIVYLNPIYENILAQQPWLRCIGRTEPRSSMLFSASRYSASLWVA